MVYLRALVHRLLGLPPPHVHDWTWGPVLATDPIQHHDEWGEPEGPAFRVAYQNGTCPCGMVKTRRVS